MKKTTKRLVCASVMAACWLANVITIHIGMANPFIYAGVVICMAMFSTHMMMYVIDKRKEASQ